MIDGMMLVWFVLLGFSIVFCVFDLPRQPILGVQKLGWFLVILYTGILGLVLYLLSCRSPGQGLHDRYIKPLWKQAMNSEVHCVAGDATGIILAAILLSLFSVSMLQEIAVEYVSAFIFGWVIFQAGMMRSMFPSYTQALTKTFFSEAVSMNTVMLGMIPVMVLLVPLLPGSLNPMHASFWFRMGLATCVGWLLGYPANYFLVKYHLKHGCMTQPGADSVKSQAALANDPARHLMHQHSEHAMHQPDAPDHVAHTMPSQGPHQHAMQPDAGHSHVQPDGQDHAGHQMASLSLAKQVFYITLTFIILLIAIYFTLI